MPTSPRVGGLASVPPPPPPPQRAARQGSVRVRVEREWKWRLRLEMAGVLASAAFQVVYLLRQWGTASRHDNVHMLLVVAYHFLILSTMLGREPTLYRRYRVWIYAVMRPLGYLSPSVRSTKAAASVLLSISATPGAWGAVMDLKRVMLAPHSRLPPSALPQCHIGLCSQPHHRCCSHWSDTTGAPSRVPVCSEHVRLPSSQQLWVLRHPAAQRSTLTPAHLTPRWRSGPSQPAL